MPLTFRRICASACLGLVLLAAAGSAPVAAQASLQEAKEAFIQGQEAYDRGNYDGAIALWQRSFELSQKLSLFYNIGLAYERLGRLEDAAAALQRFVSGTQPDDAYLDRGKARLAAVKERLALTGVLIAVDQEGATILVDGRDFGRTPRPDRIALSPGSHDVIVRKDGFSDFRSDIVLAGGQELKIDAKLAPLSSAIAPPDAAIEAEQGVAPEPEVEGSTNALGPVLTIGGGVVAATGVVIGVLALGKAQDAQSEDDADAARSLALVADISIAVGVAAAAVGAYLWFLADDEPAAMTQQRGPVLGVAPHRDGAFVTAQGRF